MSLHLRPSRFLKLRVGRRGQMRVSAGPRGPRLWQGEVVRKLHVNPWTVLLVVSLGFFMTLLERRVREGYNYRW